MLLKFDVDLAAKVRAGGCLCGGRLDVANYPRKPRGVPSTLGDEHAERLSFCCAKDGCRSRATTPSVRFLGPRVYGGAVVILAAAMLHGPSKKRVAQIEALLGIGRRTLVRWRRWWTQAFRTSRFWRSLRGRFMPGLDETALPLAMLDRLVDIEDEMSSVVALLRLLVPVSTRPWLEASAS